MTFFLNRFEVERRRGVLSAYKLSDATIMSLPCTSHVTCRVTSHRHFLMSFLVMSVLTSLLHFTSCCLLRLRCLSECLPGLPCEDRRSDRAVHAMSLALAPAFPPLRAFLQSDNKGCVTQLQCIAVSVGACIPWTDGLALLTARAVMCLHCLNVVAVNHAELRDGLTMQCLSTPRPLH